MATSSKLEATIKEHVKKRHEADDKEFLFGSERVDLRRVAHLTVEARKRDFTFLVDEPAERGGMDRGPNPLAYFMAGAAACLMNQYLTDAIYRRVKLDDIELVARGHFDRRMGGPSPRWPTTSNCPAPPPGKGCHHWSRRHRTCAMPTIR